MILSNEPVRNQSDLRGKKVWLPEGDLITFEALKSVNLSPVSLPVTDVLTGLQTGLLDLAAIPPEVAVALQWHTRIKYFTDMPLLYAMAFLAVDKRTMNRLSPEDQVVMKEVLSETYAKMDAKSSLDSADATEALVEIGIQKIAIFGKMTKCKKWLTASFFLERHNAAKRIAFQKGIKQQFHLFFIPDKVSLNCR